MNGGNMINPIIESVKFEGFIEKRESLIKEIMNWMINITPRMVSDDEEKFLLEISKRKVIKGRYYLSKKQFSWLCTIAWRNNFGAKITHENYDKWKFILKYAWFSKQYFKNIMQTINHMEKQLNLN